MGDQSSLQGQRSRSRSRSREGRDRCSQHRTSSLKRTVSQQAQKLNDHLWRAVQANSEVMVHDYLVQGANPNHSRTFHRGGDQGKFVFAPLSPRHAVRMPVLHLAVQNCAIHFDTSFFEDTPQNILKLLTDKGADRSTKCSFFVGGIAGIESEPCHDMTALEFALYVKATTAQQHKSYYEVEGRTSEVEKFHCRMDRAIDVLRGAKTVQTSIAKPTVQIAESTRGLWCSLLLSDEFSDVDFVTREGKRLPAHKCVLQASSEYFRYQILL